MQGYGRRSEDAMQRDGQTVNAPICTKLKYYFLQFLLKKNTDELADLL
jgi:hypothetical protein